jgi:subtilisin family serine protease
MRKSVAVLRFVPLFAIAVIAGPLALSAHSAPKATPSPQSSNAGGNSPSVASSSGSSTTNANSNANANSQASNKGNNGAAQSSNSQNSNSQSSSSGNNSNKNGVTAKASSNIKLNPSGIPQGKVNSRAAKAQAVHSRTSADCQTTTAASKAKVAADPCSDFIVVFEPGFARDKSNELLKNSSAQVKRQFNSIFNGTLVTGPLSKMQALANNPNVLVVEDDLEMAAVALESPAPWGLDRIDQRALPLSNSFNDSDLSGVNTYSYVVDTGIDASNVDFAGRVAPGFTAIADGRGSLDCNGHGTHVAGIIGGTQYGVAKNTNLIPVRVLDCTGSGSYSSVISGLDWIAANYRTGDAAVVNMSLGGPASSTLDGAIKNLVSKGITVVVAAGNSNADACNYSPSRVPEAITVGATESNDSRASYSNYGSCLDVFAPGSAITSTWLGTNSTNVLSGTSMASPNVAGVVARFLANNSTLTPAQVANSIIGSSTKGVVLNAGSGSANQLVYLDVLPDTTTTTPISTSPTFKKVTPRGKK